MSIFPSDGKTDLEDKSHSLYYMKRNLHGCCSNITLGLGAVIILTQPVIGSDPLSVSTNKIVESSSPTDKSVYNLLHPTPRNLLREMATDRPDKTESPYTVDAGHFQIEMDLITFSHDRDTSAGADTRINSWSVAPINLKVGLLNNFDLQLMIETWNRVKTDDRIARVITRQSGFGDVTTRLKYNLWGNDGGKTAMALMPFVKLPTNQDQLGNGSVEGGLIVPLAVELPKGWSMGLMTEFDIIEDANGQDHHPEFVNTVTFGHNIVGNLAGYLEFFSLVSSEANVPWVGTVDIGFTYAITPDIQLDTGINIGITRSADDLNPFIGISFRF